MEKLPEMVPDGARMFFVPTNPDLADILGRTDFDFENFNVFDFLGSQISGLGPAWAKTLSIANRSCDQGEGAPQIT